MSTIDLRMARVAGSVEPVPVEWLVRADGFVPKARYTSAAFADLERERLWSMLKQAYPFFADHEAGTERIIPVVILSRISPY